MRKFSVIILAVLFTSVLFAQAPAQAPARPKAHAHAPGRTRSVSGAAHTTHAPSQTRRIVLQTRRIVMNAATYPEESVRCHNHARLSHLPRSLPGSAGSETWERG